MSPVPHVWSNEELARKVGNSPKELKKELLFAKSVLLRNYAQHFTETTLDLVGKRLIGKGGYTLQWQLRRYPERPEAYDNQQNNRGCVLLLRDGE